MEYNAGMQRAAKEERENVKVRGRTLLIPRGNIDASLLTAG
jgi:hypothetical protein